MPVTASEMGRNEATTTVMWGDEEVHLTFYPGKITEAAIDHLNGAWEENSRTLVDLIKSWDVLNDDGSMFPLDPERIQTLALPFRVDVTRAIIRYIRPEARTQPS